MKKQIHNADLLYPALSYSIVGAAMDVHNELGPGWDEWDYHRAMIKALQERGHVVLSHERKNLVHRECTVDRFELDLLVDKLVILELKHIKSDFNQEHYTQTINYLKCWEKHLGMLINFGLEKLRYKRIPYTPIQGSICRTGNWEALRSSMSEKVALAVNTILSTHGFGYGAGVYRKLLWSEFEYAGVNPEKPRLTPGFGELVLGERNVDAIIVAEGLLVLVSACSSDTSATDLSYLKTYMKWAAVPCGIVVNIGKSEIQLRGVL